MKVKYFQHQKCKTRHCNMAYIIMICASTLNGNDTRQLTHCGSEKEFYNVLDAMQVMTRSG